MKKPPPDLAGSDSAAGSGALSAVAPSSLPGVCSGSLGGSSIWTAGTRGITRGTGGRRNPGWLLQAGAGMEGAASITCSFEWSIIWSKTRSATALRASFVVIPFWLAIRVAIPRTTCLVLLPLDDFLESPAFIRVDDAHGLQQYAALRLGGRLVIKDLQLFQSVIFAFHIKSLHYKIIYQYRPEYLPPGTCNSACRSPIQSVQWQFHMIPGSR